MTKRLRIRTALATGAVIATCAAGLGLAASPASASPGALAASRACVPGAIPQGRVWASWAYDPATRHVVLFGGEKTNGESGEGGVFGDTWAWSNGVWTQRHPATSPSSRTGAAIAYDYQTHQLLMFGGSSSPELGGGFSDETWLWTGGNWVQLHPVSAPSPRHNADLVYDAASHSLVLFGGYGGSYLNDTWVWTGDNWVQQHLAHSPPVRDTHSLVYDRATRDVVLWSGFSDDGNLTDTWSWDGHEWAQLHPAVSPAMQRAAWQAGYDQATRQLVVFGGNGPGNPQTWKWTGSTWQQLHPAGRPGWRKYGTITYDGALGELVLYGGWDGSKRPGSVWGWTGSTWRLIGCRD